MKRSNPGSQQLNKLQTWLSKQTIPPPPEDGSKLDSLEYLGWQLDLFSISSKDPGELSCLADLADKKAKAARAKALQESSTKWKEWVEQALVKGARQAHAWTRGAPPIPEVEVETNGSVASTPTEIIQASADAWQAIWGRDVEQEPALFERLQQVHETAQKQLEQWGPITMPMLTKAIDRTPSGTGLGFDGLAPKYLKAMPLGGKLGLLGIIRDMESDLVLPAQSQLNQVAMLDKPEGGDRPISLMPMPYRIWMRARRYLVDKWDRATAGPWDAAVPGGGALIAAFRSELQTEIATLGGKSVGGGLIDMNKFYDNVDLLLLLEEGIKHEYPLPCWY